LEREYPISAIYQDTPRYPLGPTVLPGKYTVKLTVGGKSYSQPLTVQMDPRVKTSEDGLRQQFELEMKIADAMHRDYAALQEVRTLRSQLKGLKTGDKELSNAAATLDKKAAELEGTEGGYGAVFLKDTAGRSLARLNGGFNQLLAAVDSADVAPTSQQLAMFNQVQAVLETQLTAWEQLKKQDLTSLNNQLRRAKLKEITIQ
jgi:hypothetical protein